MVSDGARRELERWTHLVVDEVVVVVVVVVVAQGVVVGYSVVELRQRRMCCQSRQREGDERQRFTEAWSTSCGKRESACLCKGAGERSSLGRRVGVRSLGSSTVAALQRGISFRFGGETGEGDEREIR